MSATSSVFPYLAGKLVVTGASRGIGEAVVITCHTGKVAEVEVLAPELADLEQHRDKTRALQQGIMQDLLTGRTRLV